MSERKGESETDRQTDRQTEERREREREREREMLVCTRVSMRVCACVGMRFFAPLPLGKLARLSGPHYYTYLLTDVGSLCACACRLRRMQAALHELIIARIICNNIVIT